MTRLNVLIETLKSTPSDVCAQVARGLVVASNKNAASYSLHLRSAGLTKQNTLDIAGTIRLVSEAEGPTLRSLSLSYNTQIKDESVIYLFSQLSNSVTEIGLVGCELGDSSAQAIVVWSQGAEQLTMLCVENNRFSKKAKQALQALQTFKPSLLVVV